MRGRPSLIQAWGSSCECVVGSGPVYIPGKVKDIWFLLRYPIAFHLTTGVCKYMDSQSHHSMSPRPLTSVPCHMIGSWLRDAEDHIFSLQHGSLTWVHRFAC